MRIFTLSALFLCAVVALAALEWPLEGSSILSSFGQNRDGRPSLSMEFFGEGIIRAADAGEIVFTSGPPSAYNGFPSGLGQWIAVDHRDSLIGLYADLRDIANADHAILEGGAILGATDTGRFRFAVYDAKENRWINPVMLFSSRVDDKAPIIKSVTLIGEDGIEHQGANLRTLRQGGYTVLIDASDTENSSTKQLFAPLRLACWLNGSKLLSVNLEYFYSVDGGLRVSAPTPFMAQAIYSDKGFILGTLRMNRGKVNLELSAQDAAGNEKIVAYSIVVE